MLRHDVLTKGRLLWTYNSRPFERITCEKYDNFSAEIVAAKIIKKLNTSTAYKIEIFGGIYIEIYSHNQTLLRVFGLFPIKEGSKRILSMAEWRINGLNLSYEKVNRKLHCLNVLHKLLYTFQLFLVILREVSLSISGILNNINIIINCYKM